MRCHTFALLIVASTAPGLLADEPAIVELFEPSPERGYELLLEKAYLPSDFDEELFSNVWKVWPDELREKAKKATPAERRRMAFSRYGFVERPGHDANDPTGPPLSYADAGNGEWVVNCFQCHGGKVAGRVIPGLPNSHLAMKTLADDVTWTRLLMQRKPKPADFANAAFPLGSSNGTTNAVGFGVAFAAMRKPDMSVKPFPGMDFEHHDMDAPPWWNVNKKSMLYVDGHAPKTHRPLMTFTLDPDTTGPRELESWENDFRHIQAYIESIEPPEYPWAIDEPLAERGRVVFEKNCARCHGTYGEEETYPEVTVPLEEISTDPVRLRALSPEHRGWLKKNWMSRYGKDPVVVEPKGYVAPPLDGVWASAPYFHNGSVPTLWHVMHSGERPVVWKRSENGYDRKRVGLEIESFEAMPDSVTDPAERRTYFDTTIKGKSPRGHTFPDALDENEKRAVLEYLKTL